ncbi:MAG: RnfABCDGE type electron transport complex subunit D [Anaerococcus sp.]|nr:RnfABCDGE type electron transport complex subunit D [Anaerococcus sp.]
MENREKLLVTSSPHVRSKKTVQSEMKDVIIALIPAGIAAVYYFGYRALILILTSVLACVLSEYLFNKTTKRKQTVKDLSAVVTGILLAAIYAAAQSTLSTGLNSVASSWALDIQSTINKKEITFEKQTKIGQRVSLVVGVFAILVSMALAHGGVKSAYEWFNGFMGLVLGILVGIFILGAFTKVANKFGATLAFIVASCVMIYIKYFVDAAKVSFWSYSIISILVSLVVGVIASKAYNKAKGIKEEPVVNSTIYNQI